MQIEDYNYHDYSGCFLDIGVKTNLKDPLYPEAKRFLVSQESFKCMGKEARVSRIILYIGGGVTVRIKEI